MQRIGQRPHAADAGRFGPDRQRQDAHGSPVCADQQDASRSAGAEMPPIDFQPVQRLEEGCVAGLRQSRIPKQAMAGQRLNAVNFFDLNHGVSRTVSGPPTQWREVFSRFRWEEWMQPPCRSRGELPRQRGRSGCIPLYCKQLCRRRQRPCGCPPLAGNVAKTQPRRQRKRSFHATPVAKGQREKLRTPPPARPFLADFANRSRLIHLPQHQKRALSNARRDVLGKTRRKLYHARYDLTLTTYQARYNIKRGGEPVWNAKCNFAAQPAPKGTRHEPGGRGQVGRSLRANSHPRPYQQGTAPTFPVIRAIAVALQVEIRVGEEISVDPLIDPDDCRKQRAWAKAIQLVQRLQGSMGLEAQAVDSTTIDKMVDRTMIQLFGRLRRTTERIDVALRANRRRDAY